MDYNDYLKTPVGMEGARLQREHDSKFREPSVEMPNFSWLEEYAETPRIVIEVDPKVKRERIEKNRKVFENVERNRQESMERLKENRLRVLENYSTINPNLTTIARAAIGNGLTSFSMDETKDQTVYINGKFVRLSERYNARGKVE